jgi:hypothetical protein
VKLSEALSELGKIEKQIRTNCENIQRYSSTLSTEIPLLNNHDAHRIKIKELEQSNKDKWKRYAEIYLLIKLTNLVTTATFEDEEYCLEEALLTLRKGCDTMLSMYAQMNENKGKEALRSAIASPDRIPQVIRFYDEEHRVDEIRKWQDMKYSIEPRLAVVNATTELLDIDLNGLREWLKRAYFHKSLTSPEEEA